jgi:spore coat polysaccharide biosynthesis predicted glycosyltransferase SpsG
MADLDQDLAHVLAKTKTHNNTVVITDSYTINAYYLEKLKNSGAFVISIDDLAQIHFASDVVINQNIYAREMEYSTTPYTTLLLGPQYVLLQKDCVEQRAIGSFKKRRGCSILVTMGGSDPANQTKNIIDALNELDEKMRNEVVMHVLVGPGYLSQQVCFPASHEKNIPLKIHYDPANLYQLMAQADVAVSAGGSTCYELAYLGVPTLIISQADNQKKIAEKMDEEGVSIYLGYCDSIEGEEIKNAVIALITDEEKRERMSKRGQKLIDGQGVKRVVKEIKTLIQNS